MEKWTFILFISALIIGCSDSSSPASSTNSDEIWDSEDQIETFIASGKVEEGKTVTIKLPANMDTFEISEDKLGDDVDVDAAGNKIFTVSGILNITK
ncbi:hypothetical protein [Photobacterium satsumensis]|uniref:hypothetical protein n=1 Tax=Photobacterium satsumensis TaxID=2910239 RepID=UPI003D11EBC7